MSDNDGMLCSPTNDKENHSAKLVRNRKLGQANKEESNNAITGKKTELSPEEPPIVVNGFSDAVSESSDNENSTVAVLDNNNEGVDCNGVNDGPVEPSSMDGVAPPEVNGFDHNDVDDFPTIMPAAAYTGDSDINNGFSDSNIENDQLGRGGDSAIESGSEKQADSLQFASPTFHDSDATNNDDDFSEITQSQKKEEDCVIDSDNNTHSQSVLGVNNTANSPVSDPEEQLQQEDGLLSLNETVSSTLEDILRTVDSRHQNMYASSVVAALSDNKKLLASDDSEHKEPAANQPSTISENKLSPLPLDNCLPISNNAENVNTDDAISDSNSSDKPKTETSGSNTKSTFSDIANSTQLKSTLVVHVPPIDSKKSPRSTSIISAEEVNASSGGTDIEIIQGLLAELLQTIERNATG